MHLKIVLTTVLFLLVCLSNCAASVDRYANLTDSEIAADVVHRWELFEGRIKELANKAVKLLLPRLMEAQGSMNISGQCMRESMILINGLRKIKPWALRLLDASAKMVDGLLTGTMSSFGAYDQCVTTFVKDEKSRTNKDKILFQGKYCAVNLKPALPPKPKFYQLNEVLPMLKNFSEKGTAIGEAAIYAHFFYFISVRLGFCVPSGCTDGDVQQLVEILGDYLYLNATVYRCELQQEKEFTPIILAVITTFSFLGFIMLIGTMIDVYTYYTHRVFNNICARILLCFSFLSNFKKFVDTKTSSDTLSCLNGIRFLCMSWVVLGHTYLIINFQIFRGLESVRDYAKDFAFQAVVNASVAVDTFFSIGGLLVAYVTVKVVKDMGKKLDIKLFIFHRIWRIWPVYASVVAFMVLGTIMGDGPIWHETTNEFLKACRDNWWANLLFINNFYDPEHMCIPQSWYIASDMQLYIASLIVLIPLLRWPKVGLSIAGVGVVAAMIYSGVFTYLNDYPPAMLFAHPDPVQRNEYWANFYFKPYVHAGPYCLGLMAGYLLATRPNLKIPKLALISGWCLAIISNMSVLYGVLEWNSGRDPELVESMFYASLNRTAWSLGICWMIVCCATGHGGVINYILSWKAFIPLGRLTFIAYLVHPLVQVTVLGNLRAQVQPAHYFAVWVYLGNLCVTYSSAFAGSMLVEAPFLALEKIIMPRGEGPEKNKSLPAPSNLKGSLKVAKNGDLAAVISDKEEEESSQGTENNGFVCRL